MVPAHLLIADPKRVSATAVRLYGILDRYAGEDGIAFPSRTTLAKHLGRGRDTVDRALKQLIAAGAITVEQRRDDAGDWTSNRYEVVARIRLGRRAEAVTPPDESAHGGRAEPATGSRADAAQIESQVDREPGEGEAGDEFSHNLAQLVDPGDPFSILSELEDEARKAMLTRPSGVVEVTIRQAVRDGHRLRRSALREYLNKHAQSQYRVCLDCEQKMSDTWPHECTERVAYAEAAM
jgi:hypothetical protein